MTQVLDVGYVNYVESWGSDQRIVEAARMSTDKGFLGWDSEYKYSCGVGHYEMTRSKPLPEGEHMMLCPYASCFKPMQLIGSRVGDEKLLAYLWKNRHMTPFEMAGMILEVKAPIMVFREWHRHRTQGYNEMSARYVPLPDENYMPTRERIIAGVMGSGANRQAQGTVSLDHAAIGPWLDRLKDVYEHAQSVYEMGINIGIPKELARLPVPVARYSRMRVSANLRNWLQFLELRDSQHAPNAQWEIRQYADAVGGFLKEQFPRTMALFQEEKNDG